MTCRLISSALRAVTPLIKRVALHARRWSLVEAIMVADVCPDRLPVLVRNVRRVGEAEAARSVDRQIESALKAGKIR